MQKIRKILRAVSEKTALPTNQPIITNNTNLIGPRWPRSKKYGYLKCYEKQQMLNFVSSVNVTKSVGNYIFGHTYWKNP